MDGRQIIARHGLWGIFVVCFLSATLLPGVSEVGLAALIIAGTHRPLPLVATATAGNTLGSLFTFATGWLFGIDKLTEWMGIEWTAVEGVAYVVEDYGCFAGLFVWLPIVGDPIAACLGIMHSQPIATSLMVFSGKAIRYSVIAFIAMRTDKYLKTNKKEN